MSNLYSKDPVKIDYTKCVAAGEVLLNYEPPVEQHLWTAWDLNEILAFKLVFVAICHDINWDFLQNTLAEIFSNDREKLSPSFLASVNARVVMKWLEAYEKPERVRAPGRARLIRDVGVGLAERFGSKAINLVEGSDGTLFGSNGFYSKLEVFAAYKEDPLRKKSNVLVHDLVRENLFHFPDTDKINPAIEYHIMRLYERTGRIFPRRNNLRNALIKGQPLPPWYVTAFRKATAEALTYTAVVSQNNIPNINYVEWQIARNICTTYEPNCLIQSVDTSLPSDIKNMFSGCCPYLHFCFAYNEDRASLSLKEPIPTVKRTFY